MLNQKIKKGKEKKKLTEEISNALGIGTLKPTCLVSPSPVR